MCLSIAIHAPDRVLGRGEHLGYAWVVVHNGMGYRCGYVRVPAGHPWHGQDYNALDVRVHGGLTFAEADEPCDDPGPDDAVWYGFDTAHAYDAPDRTLPLDPPLTKHPMFWDRDGHTWTQAEVEAACRDLCAQAAAAGGA